MLRSKITTPDTYNPSRFVETCHNVFVTLESEIPPYYCDWTLARLGQQIHSEHGNALLASRSVVPSPETVALVHAAKVSFPTAQPESYRPHEIALVAILRTFSFKPYTMSLEDLISRVSFVKPKIFVGFKERRQFIFQTLMEAMHSLCNDFAEQIRILSSCCFRDKSPLEEQLVARPKGRDCYGRPYDTHADRFMDQNCPPRLKEEWFEHIAPAALLLHSQTELLQLPPANIAAILSRGIAALSDLFDADPPFPDFSELIRKHHERQQALQWMWDGTEPFHLPQTDTQQQEDQHTAPAILFIPPQAAGEVKQDTPKPTAPAKTEPPSRPARVHVRRRLKWPEDERT